MKKLLFLSAFAVIAFISVSFVNTTHQAPVIEYRVVTVVESIVPNGLGRSRMISSTEEKDYKTFTTLRSGEKGNDKKNKSKRSEIRVKNYEETKLLNF